jgi:hypothetical protein
MENENLDPQQFFTPAPTPLNISAPETHAMQDPKPSGRKRPITTSHSLTVFEPRLLALLPEAAAKELVNAMRIIITKGGRQRQWLDMRRQKIRDLLQKLGDREVVRVYNEFATAHEQVEKRLTFKLPLMEELEGEGREVEEVDEARDDTVSYGAREDNAREDAAIGSALQEVVRLEVARDPDVELDDIPSPSTLQPSAIGDVHPETALSPPPLPLIQPSLFLDAGVDGNCTIVPVQNPDAFPVGNIQEVQAEYYTSVRIIDMCIHQDGEYAVTQVTATMDKGPVNYLIIKEPRIITSLGFREAPYDTICLQPNSRLDETYQIHIQPGQVPRNPEAWIVGELVSARHAYLYWLDSKQTADPVAPPTIAEAKILAPKIGRRASDVWMEIERCWKIEQGSSGKRYRENRMEYLGEDPSYPQGNEKRSLRSMWI